MRALADVHNATQQERLSYGAYVKEMRTKLEITQEELAEAAGITSRTLSNIENQKTAGQADKLVRIFRALGIELEYPAWSQETQSYIAMIAPLLEKINPVKRLAVMQEVLTLLADEIETADSSDSGPNSSQP